MAEEGGGFFALSWLMIMYAPAGSEFCIWAEENISVVGNVMTSPMKVQKRATDLTDYFTK